VLDRLERRRGGRGGRDGLAPAADDLAGARVGR
jgi:hypothetical protein